MGGTSNPQQQIEEQKKSLFDMFNPFSGGFGLGSILKMLLFLPIIYAISRFEPAQALIGKVVDWFDGDKIDNGKEKVKAFMDDINLGIAGFMPSVAKLIGLEGKLGEKLESFTTADEAKTFLKGKIPDELLGVVAENTETWKSFVSTVKNAQPSKKLTAPGEVTNSYAIGALIAEQPSLTKKLVTAALKGGSDGKPSDTTKKIFSAVKEIIGDDARFAQLINGANRRNTLDIMASVMGGATKADELEKRLFAADGTLKPGVKELLVTLCEQGEEGKLTSLQDAMGTRLNDGKTSAEAKQGITALAVDSADVMLGAANKEAYAALRTAVGDATMQKLITTSVTHYSDDPAQNDAAMVRATTRLVTQDLKTATAFKQFAESANLAAIPQEHQYLASALGTLRDYASAGTTDRDRQRALAALSNVTQRDVDLKEIQTVFTAPDGTPTDMKFVFNQLFVKENRDLIRKAVTTSDGKTDYSTLSWLIYGAMPHATAEQRQQFNALVPITNDPKNLELFLNTAEAIENRSTQFAAQANNPTAAPVANTVLSALFKLVSGDQTAFKQLQPAHVEWFFKDPGYRQTIENLIHHLRLPANTENGKALIALQRDWGSLAPDASRKNAADRDGYGLIEVLSSAHAIKELQTYFMKDKKLSRLDKIWGGVNIERTDPALNKLAQNQDYLTDLMNFMPKPVEVSRAASLTPQPTGNAAIAKDSAHGRAGTIAP